MMQELDIGNRKSENLMGPREKLNSSIAIGFFIIIIKT